MEVVQLQPGQDTSEFHEITIKGGDILVFPTQGASYVERFSDFIKTLHAEGARRLGSSSG